MYSLAPLINGMVVDEDRFYLECAEKPLVFRRAIVDIEGDEGGFRCNIAISREMNQRKAMSVIETTAAYKDAWCFHTGL